jgi:ankyrin repeat protein
MDLKVIQGTVRPFKESSIADDEFNTSFNDAGHDLDTSSRHVP